MTNYVRSKVPVDELLAMLAEEAVEVAHAALKLRRVYNGINPTPVSEDEATEKFYEELADFTLVTRVIGVNPGYRYRRAGRLCALRISGPMLAALSA